MRGMDLQFPAFSGDSRSGNGTVSGAAFKMEHDRNNFLNSVRMGDDSDQFSMLLESSQLFQGMLEVFLVESAEAFIEEEGVDPHAVARHPGEPERKSKTDKECFASGKIAGGTNLIAAIGILYIEFKTAFGIRNQGVAVAELCQLFVGMFHERFQSEGLDKGSIFFPVA